MTTAAIQQFVSAFSAALLHPTDPDEGRFGRMHACLHAALAGRKSVVLDVRFTGLTPHGAAAPTGVDPLGLRAAAHLIVLRVSRLGFTPAAAPNDLAEFCRVLAKPPRPEEALLGELADSAPRGVYLATASGAAYRPGAGERPGASQPVSDGEPEAKLSDFEVLDPRAEVEAAHQRLSVLPAPDRAQDDGSSTGGGLFDLFRSASSDAMGHPERLAEALRRTHDPRDVDAICRSALETLAGLLQQGNVLEALTLAGTVADEVERPDRSRVFRETAVRTLRSAAEERTATHLVRVLPPDREFRARVLRFLALLGTKAAEPLEALLFRTSDAELRLDLLGLCTTLEGGTERLLARFAACEAPDAASAVLDTAVARSAERPELQRWLEAGTKHPHQAVRSGAARHAGTIGGQVGVRVLAGALQDPATEVRKAVIAALGSVRDAVAVPFLVRAADNDDEELQIEAVLGFGRLGLAEGVAPLLAIARRRQLLGRKRLARLKRAAVTALGMIPGRSADEALRELARSGDEEVAVEARRLLRQEGGG